MDFTTYENLGFKKLDQKKFESVSADAELLISNLTQDFYSFHDLDAELSSEDNFLVYRATQYEKAICLQAEFAIESGATTPYAQQAGALTDVQIGRTHLQRTSNAMNNVTYGKSGVVVTAYNVLGRTGLLYRGVDHNW